VSAKGAIAAALLASLAVTLAGCGGSGKPNRTTANPRRSDTLVIYSSLPLQGALAGDGRATVAGIRLALRQAGARAGDWRIRYVSLDDASAVSGTWDLDRTIANAHRAVSDPGAVYYIGEFSSAASEVSIPILNQAGLAQVSPSNTYVGLTTSDPGSVTGEPQRYYPTGARTYLRIIPRDTVQAAAGLLAMRQAGCTRAAIAHDGEPYGAGLAASLEAQKGYYGVSVVSSTQINPNVPDYRSYALGIRLQGVDCLFLAATTSATAVQLTRDVHLAIPSARIFGGDGLCTGSYTNPAQGGVGATIAPLLECTRMPQRLTAYPGGRSFLAAYRAVYGPAAPDPYAIYGYEAMKLGLDTIASLGRHANSKAAMLQALLATSSRHSVLGTYGFDKDGDTTLRSYGLYGVGTNGNPAFLRTITPTRVL